MKYVRTYELFGNLFGKKKGVSKNVKSFLAHEKEEKDKKDKQEKEQKAASERAEARNKRFRERIESTIERTSHPSIDRIRMSDNHFRSSIEAIVYLNDEFITNVVKDSFPNTRIKNATMTIEFRIRHDFDKIRYSGNKNKNYMGISYAPDSSYIQFDMNDIIDYKGNIESEVKRFQIRGSHNSGFIDRERPDISYDPTDSDILDLSPLNRIIIDRSSSAGRWISMFINEKIEHLKELKSLEAIRSFTDEEAKDYLSDLIDLSNEEYEIDRDERSIWATINIPGLLPYNGKRLKINKITSQVIKLLTEIQGRLEDRDLEISVDFEYDKLEIHISMITPNEKTVDNKVQPRRMAP